MKNNELKNDSPIILYDGICRICNRFVQFVLKRDKRNQFRFSPLQSQFAASALARHNKNPEELQTVFVLVDFGRSSEYLLEKGKAVSFVMKTLGGIWTVFQLRKFLPTGTLNFFYDLVARNRYQIFGKFDRCPLPTPEQKEKFLED